MVCANSVMMFGPKRSFPWNPPTNSTVGFLVDRSLWLVTSAQKKSHFSDPHMTGISPLAGSSSKLCLILNRSGYVYSQPSQRSLISAQERSRQLQLYTQLNRNARTIRDNILRMDKRMQSTDLSSSEKRIDQYVFNFRQGKLGHGQYGTVYKGYHVETKEEVAIKIIRKVDLVDREDTIQLHQEVRIMELLHSPNVVKMIDVLQTDNNYYLVMEYCQLGDLDRLMAKLDPNEHYKFLIDMLTAFTQLIQQGIIHRDLKPANILVQRVGKETVYKLGDFGFARSVRSYHKEMLQSKVGTPLYMSPQLLDGQYYSSKSDIWSLAFITYQIIYMKTPWIGRTEDELLLRIINMPLAFPEKPKVPELAKDFLRGCLQIAEKDRFSWDQIYLHPYVAAKFTDYIELSRSLERKVNYLLNSLRERVNKLDLKKLFHGLDTSGDRALNQEEFSHLMWKIDKDLEMREIALVFDEIDKDGNGNIDYGEFKQALRIDTDAPTRFVPMDPKVMEILSKLSIAIQKYNINIFQLFQRCDVSGNGSLDREELQQLLEKIDNTLGPKEIEAALNAFDENGDGEVQFSEFRRVFDNIENDRFAFKPKQQSEVREYFNNRHISHKELPDTKLEVDEGGNDITKRSSHDLIKQSNGVRLIPMMLKKR